MVFQLCLSHCREGLRVTPPHLAALLKEKGSASTCDLDPKAPVCEVSQGFSSKEKTCPPSSDSPYQESTKAFVATFLLSGRERPSLKGKAKSKWKGQKSCTGKLVHYQAVKDTKRLKTCNGDKAKPEYT